jgi:hypothetical protein
MFQLKSPEETTTTTMMFKRSPTTATMITKALLICSLMETASGLKSHYSPPSEDNVFSPPICRTNQDGFGGKIGTDVFTVEYYYEMELEPDPAELDDIIFKLELSIAVFLLQTTEFNEIPCQNRRLEIVESPRFKRDQRRLTAVGLTINPPDYPIDGRKYLFSMYLGSFVDYFIL